jgi:hypothetical protein
VKLELITIFLIIENEPICKRGKYCQLRDGEEQRDKERECILKVVETWIQLFLKHTWDFLIFKLIDFTLS